VEEEEEEEDDFEGGNDDSTTIVMGTETMSPARAVAVTLTPIRFEELFRFGCPLVLSLVILPLATLDDVDGVDDVADVDEVVETSAGGGKLLSQIEQLRADTSFINVQCVHCFVGGVEEIHDSSKQCPSF